mgnify:CR=1 FL=1
MKRLLLIPIVLFAKLLVVLLKTSGRGSGTALPGLLVDRYFPFAFRALIQQIPSVVVITGTNGKTTTQTMLSDILRQVPGIKLLNNRAGANLKQGILSQLLKQASPLGRLDFTHAVLEVEEATLPRIAKLLRPDAIAITNLYRDQLDAYGEVDVTEKLIRNGIAQCPRASVVVNGDDPRTSRLSQGLFNPTYFTSLDRAYSQAMPYEGQLQNTSHLVHNILRAAQLQVNPDLTTDVNVQGDVRGEKVQLQVKVASPGLFHIYNALTAITLAKLLNIDSATIVRGFDQFQPAFGRGEILTREHHGKRVHYQILLVKNPASFTLTLDLLKNIRPLRLMLAINDNIADSRDVSWLWDSRLEILSQATLDWILCTGIRAKDMKLRLKYALEDGIGQYQPAHIHTEESIGQAINQAFELASPDETVYVMPTYTAMLEFRKLMGKTLQ